MSVSKYKVQETIKEKLSALNYEQPNKPSYNIAKLNHIKMALMKKLKYIKFRQCFI
jgi:hypothetical protein